MKYGIFCRSVSTIYDRPAMTKETEKGTLSAITDEGLYGMACQVLDSKDGWDHIITHYGYAGYVKSNDLLYLTEEEMKEYLRQQLAVVDVPFADVLNLPVVQGDCLFHLAGGCLIQVLPEPCQVQGWSKVRLLDRREGYIRTPFLEKKRFREDFLWKDSGTMLEHLKEIPARAKTAEGGQEGFSLKALLGEHYHGSEELFRRTLVNEARKYLGTQYRWGGKSFQGIDCSGLVSMVYMRSGVLIYRDASIADGYPMCRIPVSEVKKGLLREGDALYFPGHIAMYIGNGRYIHSTAHADSGGVVVNSLHEGEPDYRRDLAEGIIAAAGIR